MTVLLAAMRAEAAALRRGAGTVPVLRAGVGPGHARRAAARLAGRRAALAGLGGGLAGGLRTGDVVVADRLHRAGDPTGVPAPSGHRAVAEALRAAGLAVRVGTVVSASRPVLTDTARARLAADGALLVDTESYWLAATGVLACVVRVVADPADRAVLRPATLLRLRAALRALPTVGAVLAHRFGTSGSPAGPTPNGPTPVPPLIRTTDRVAHTEEVR